jgi:hypothetical protein
LLLLLVKLLTSLKPKQMWINLRGREMFNVFTAESVGIRVFWGVIPCDSVSTDRDDFIFRVKNSCFVACAEDEVHPSGSVSLATLRHLQKI